jgi:Domain of unknown function (DUF3598)
MRTNWENFLQNLGHWRGSFTQVSPDGTLLESVPSLLSLEGFEANELVKFRLRRFGPGGESAPPIDDIEQDYRSLGRQIIFFDTGAFSKGTLQLAPYSDFGAEYGFVAPNRRLRLVQLYDVERNFNKLVLIREFRCDTDAQERPPLTVEALLGTWVGKACTAYPDLRPADYYTTRLEVRRDSTDEIQQTLFFQAQQITSNARIEGNKLCFESGDLPRQILLLPDGASSNVPLHLALRQPFFVEVGWLIEPNTRERLIRSYSEKGEWISSTHIIENRLPA